MIFNIEPSTFGGPARNGDLIAICNVIQHLRNTNENQEIRFYMKEGTISSESYVQQFFLFLSQITNYFSHFEGSTSLPWKNVNVWDYRDISGDLVKISNHLPNQKKVVVFPLVDEKYNTYRNWPQKTLMDVISNIENSAAFKDYEKILCTNVNCGDMSGWTISNDFLTNIMHIMTAEVFVGGDTGTSHFAWALDNGPDKLIYYNSSRGLLHTLPFYLTKGKGELNTYWLDFENTSWN